MGLGGISIGQLLIVLVIVALIFGTKRLRGIGGDLGGAIKGFKKAINDVQFKIVSEKLKKYPINENTEITVKHYRLITGACDLGVREFMKSNDIEFNVIDGETVENNPIKAIDLVPILSKGNAYGIEKFKSLLTF